MNYAGYPFGQSSRVNKLTAVVGLLDGMHNLRQRLAVGPAQLQCIIMAFHPMSSAVIRDATVLLWILLWQAS